MTKERLRHYQTIKREREQLQSQLADVAAALLYPKVQQLSGMPGSGQKEGNPQEDLMIHHIELQDRYKAKLEELAAEQLAVEQAIEPLEATARMLLRYRYIDGLKWEEVCCRMNYSWRQVHRLHGDALRQLRAAEEKPGV